jgi:hypothetical protein
MILIRTNHSWLRVGRHKCRALVEAGRDRSEEARTAVAQSGGQSADGGLQVARGQMSQWLEAAARQRGATWPVVVCNQGGGGAGDGWRCVRRVRARDGRWWCRAQVEEAVWRWLGHEWRVRVSGPARRGSCEFNYF